MRDLNELRRLLDATKSQFTKLTFEATVVTGFEQVALDECIEKFGTNVTASWIRGRIFFNTKFDKYENYKKLRSVDHVNVLVGLTDVALCNDKEKDLKLIKNTVHSFDWEKALTIWQEVFNFKGIVYPALEDYNYAVGFEKKKVKDDNDNEKFKSNSFHYIKTDLEKALDDVVGDSSDDETKQACPLTKQIPRFRVTCNRVGERHSFTSMEAAWVFGGKLQDKFHWIVDLSNYDIDVILEINKSTVYASISLNLQSNHVRNIQFFGPTTLRATICHNMLRLCCPKPGDVIIDPLCGGGSIPIEGSISYPTTFHLGGEQNEVAITKTHKNITALNDKNLKVDAIRWDATHLPLKDDSVDIFVTDLPFGKRIGSKSNNKLLYRKVLSELARVVKLSTGKSVFLTYDQNSFSLAFQFTKIFWKQTQFLNVNIGGLRAGCFLLQRTSEPYFLKLSKKDKKMIKKREWEKKKKELELES